MVRLVLVLVRCCCFVGCVILAVQYLLFGCFVSGLTRRIRGVRVGFLALVWFAFCLGIVCLTVAVVQSGYHIRWLVSGVLVGLL